MIIYTLFINNKQKDYTKRGTEACNGRFICSTVSYITQLAKRM